MPADEFQSTVTRAHMLVNAASNSVGVRFKSAVSRTLMDARWKHTWSLSYVLLIEVLWHPA